MENERYIYGVGLVIVKGARVEYLLHQLVPVIMNGASKSEIKKVLRGNFERVADKLRVAARTYLKDDPELIDRLNRRMNFAVHWMRKRGDMAHSTWILDPDAPPGWDTRLHIRTEGVWFVGDKALETIAERLGLASVNIIQLTSDVLKRKGTEQTIPMPKDPRITRLKP